jgi:hypothetical protein
VAVDAPVCLYQLLATASKDSNVTGALLKGFYFRIIKMIQGNLRPVFIFDGKVWTNSIF